MSSMKEVWAYLNNEYGKKDVLAADQITDLHTFQASKAAHTDSAKFEEYYQMWREVHCDLKKVRLESSLNNPHALELFLSKLPTSSREQYVNLKNRPTMNDKPLVDIMNEFMTTEQIRQGDLKRLETLSSGGKKEQREPKPPASKCGKCGRTGHLD